MGRRERGERCLGLSSDGRRRWFGDESGTLKKDKDKGVEIGWRKCEYRIREMQKGEHEKPDERWKVDLMERRDRELLGRNSGKNKNLI